MILIVLASGRGSRLKNLTKDKPKCLIKIYKNKRLIDYISENFKYFKKVIVVTGYKSHINSNMVETLMIAKNEINKEDIIVSYSDIFFDPRILKFLINKKNNVLPLNKAWFKLWKKRFKSLEEIKKDAENIIINKKKIKSLGEKILKKLPNLQFMGILKITSKTFIIMNKFYKELDNKKISMTEFINLIIKMKLASFNYINTNKFWYEVDSSRDLKILKNDIKKFT